VEKWPNRVDDSRETCLRRKSISVAKASDRLLEKLRREYVDSFEDYQLDVKAMLARVKSSTCRNIICSAIPAGGCIRLRSLYEKTCQSISVFSAMWGSRCPQRCMIAWGLSSVSKPVGFQAVCPGQQAETYVYAPADDNADI
jgi:lysophospholipase